MSNRKNNKSKKTTNNSHIDFNSFRIEALEPRLLMSATAAEWQDELTTFDGQNNQVESIVSVHSGQFSLEIEGLQVVEVNSTSGDETSSLAKLSDLVSASDVNSLNWDALEQDISNAVSSRITAYVASQYSDEEAAVAIAQEAFDNASSAERQAAQNALNAAQSALTAAIAQAEGADISAQNLATILSGLNVSTNLGGSLSSTAVSHCEFTANADETLSVGITLFWADHFQSNDQTLAADISESGADVNFVTNDPSQQTDVGGTLRLAFTLDGVTSTDVNRNLEVSAGVNFEQDISDEGKAARFGILDLESKDVSKNTPDLRLGGILSLNAGNPSFAGIMDADLRFSLPDAADFDSSLGIADTTSLILKNDATHSWSWGNDDAVMQKFDKVEMGEILGKLSSLSKWLSDQNTGTIDSNFQKQQGLLYADFSKLVDQNATSFLNLSSMLDVVLKTPPESLQAMMNALNTKNTASDTISFTTVGGERCAVIPFSLSLPNTAANVSLVEAFFSTYNLKVQSKNSLTLTSNATLTFDLVIPLVKADSLTPTNTLADIGLTADTDWKSVFDSPVLVADQTLGISGRLSSNADLLLNGTSCTITSASTDLNQLVSDLLAEITTATGLTGVADSSGFYMLYSGSSFTLKSASGFESGYRDLGLSGITGSQLAFVSTGTIASVTSAQSIAVTDDASNSVEVSYKGDINSLSAALNVAFSTHSNFSSYSARVIGDKLVILALDKPTFSLSLSTISGSMQNVVISSTLPVNRPGADVSFNLSLDGGITSTAVSISEDNFAGVTTIADMASVIQSALKKEGLAVTVEVRDGRIAFRYSGDADKLQISFNNNESASVLGFSALTESSTADCLSLTFKDRQGNTQTVSINLWSFIQNKTPDVLASTKIAELLQAIADQCNLKLTTQTALTSDGLSLQGLTEVKDLHGFSLAALLGMNGKLSDGQTLKANASVSNSTDSNSTISFSNFNLAVNHQLTGDAKLKALYGVLGVDVTGTIALKQSGSFTLLNGQLKDGAMQWKCESQDTSANVFTARFSAGLDSQSTTQQTMGTIKLTPSGSWGSAAAINKQWIGNTSIASIVSQIYSSPSYSISNLLSQVKTTLSNELLGKILGSGYFISGKALPLLGKSASALLGIQTKVNDVLLNISSNYPKTLQELNLRLQEKLGGSLDFVLTASGLDVALRWDSTFASRKIQLGSMDFGDSALVFGGTAEAYLNASADLLFAMHLTACEPAEDNDHSYFTVTLDADSHLDVNLSLVGQPLAFDLSMGYSGLSVPLLQVVSASSKPSYLALSASFGVKLTADTAVSDFTTAEDLTVTSNDFKIGGELYVQCAGLDVGKVSLGVVQSGAISSWNGTASNSSGQFALANGTLPGFQILYSQTFLSANGSQSNVALEEGKVVLDISQLNVDLSEVSLFEKLRLVADGLGDTLRRAQSGMTREFLSADLRNIPFVGDSIINAADCLSSLDSDFVTPFRKFVNNAVGLNAEAVAKYLYTLLKQAGVFGALADCSVAGKAVTWAGSTFDRFYNGIQYIDHTDSTTGERCAEWRFCLTGDYTLDADADFDLGFPGLGLRADGGISAGLKWVWNLGFGISESRGAYLLLSNGAAGEDYVGNTQTGDDIAVQLTVKPHATTGIEGQLGFLSMNATIENYTGTDGTSPDFASDGLVLNLGVDLNDGENKKGDDAKDDLTSDGTVPTRISFSNLGSGLSIEASLVADLHLRLKTILGFDGSILGDKSMLGGFPEVGATFAFDWNASVGHMDGEITKAGFEGIYFDAGSFINRVLGPMVRQIKKVLDPIQPLIDFLQTEIPVINKLPGSPQKITVLSLVQSVAASKGINLGMLDDVIQLANLAKKLSGSQNELKIDLGNLTFVEKGNGSLPTSGMDFLKGVNTSASIDNIISSFRTSIPKDEGSGQNEGQKKVSALGCSEIQENGISYGWSFPILKDPVTEVLGLFFGRHANLVTYNMRPLEFNFEWTKSFVIVGPLCADVGFNFGVCIDLEFGYDTLGLENWKDSGFKDMWSLVDGFYINDLEHEGTKDVSEVVFHSGIIAGASVAGRAGVNVGVNLNVNLNLNDPNNDGKVRLYEMADNLKKSPFAIFDTSVTIQARAYAYLDYFFGRKEWDLWKSGALEIFNTKKDPTPTLATEQNGDVVVNVGDYASKRNIGDLSDGADTVTVTVTGTNKVKIGYGSTTSDEYTIASGNTLIINSGNGNDEISFVNSSSTPIAFNIQINGGEGNDKIDLTNVTFDTVHYAILTGGAGNDTIIGSAGRDYIFGDEGYVIYKEDENTENTENTPKTPKIVKTVEAYVDSGVAGNDQIFAGADIDVVLGGGGHDFISGDGGEDILFGDGGRVEYDAAGTATASRSNLFDEGGNDTIYGGAGGDFIYAGAGNDNVNAGSGDDFVFGDKGVDVVYGGSGDDTIDGGDGVDVLFGDTPATALLLAQANSIAGVLPWAYVSSDLKKSGSRLLNANQIKLFDFNENYAENYLNALSADDRNDLLEKLNAKYSKAGNYSELKNYSLKEFFVYDLNQNFVASESVTENDDDKITGGLGSDIIFGDAGLNNATGGNDVLSGGVGNDFIDGDGGNDQIAGETGEDILYGGQGNDTLDGGTGDDFVFGDDGWNGYASARTAVGTDLTGLYSDNPASSDEQKDVFGAGMAAFATNFRIQSTAVASTDGGNDVIAAGQGSDFVDGQFGNDTYNVKFFGEYNLGYTNVMDSGTDSADSLTVYGTSDADELLIRASDAGLGFVALLPDSDPDTDAGEGKTRIERVNFWSDASRAGSGMDQMTVNAGLGDDEIAIDSTLSSITVNGEGGDDSITVGQLYHSARGTDATSANLASLDAFGIKNPDAFGTTETTQGFLSDGVNHASSITGGTGNDTITVLHTSAALSLSGNSGDDTFNIFSFVDTDLNPIMNGPMLVNGGAGTDTLSIAGSEGDDTFVYTTEGISATGVSVQSINVEKDQAFGGAGDDSFYLLSSTKEQSRYIAGGLGNDSFYNGGVQTDANYIEVENADYRGHSGQIDHTVTASGTSDYVSGAASGISVNIVDDDETASDATTVQVVFTNAASEIADPSPVIEEGTEAIAYYVALSKAPAAGETVEVTVFAPGVSDGDLQRGDRGILLAKTGDTIWGSYVTLTFTASNWNVGQAVRVIAPSDLLREGNMTVGLLHSTKVVPASGATTANTKVGLCRNMLLSVVDKSTMNQTDGFAVTQKLFLTSEEATAKKIILGLNALPQDGSIQIWREGYATALTNYTREGNGLYITLDTVLPAGTVFYVHYTSSALVIENQSVVNLSYEMNDGATPVVALVQSDDACMVQPQTSASAGDAYYYALNGTALSFYDTATGSLQTLSGNFIGLFTSTWTGGTSVTLARDVMAGTALTFTDATGISISIASKNNAQSEDVYYYGYDTVTGALTIYSKATDAAVSMTGTMTFYSAVAFSNASSIALDSAFVSGTSVLLTVSHVSFIPREGALASGDIYYYRIDGTQLVIFNSVTKKPQSISGTLLIAGHSLVTPPDEAIPVDTTSDAKVVIEPTNGSTDVAEIKNAAGESVYTDAYTITLNGALLTGTQTVTVNINAVSTPYATMDGSRGEAVQVEVYEIDFVAADGTRTVIATLASDGADALKSVTFTAASWATIANKTVCGKFYVHVRAVDDSVAESDALSVIPVGESTIANIKGTTHEDGAGEDGPELPTEPKVLYYGLQSSVGTVKSGPVDETLSAVATEDATVSETTTTVSKPDKWNTTTVETTVTKVMTSGSAVAKVTTTTKTTNVSRDARRELNGYADDFVAIVSGKTITFVASALTPEQVALLVKRNTIVATAGAQEGEVREIESVTPDSNGNYVVILNEAFLVDASFRCTVGVARPSLFVNEEECTDRIFVNNQDNSSEATDALNSLSSAIAETPVIVSEWTNLLDKVSAKLVVMDALSNLSSAISADSGINSALVTLSSAINATFASDSNVTSAWNALSSAITAELDATAALDALATAIVTNLDVKTQLEVLSSMDNANFVSNYVISSTLSDFASALDKQMQDIDSSKTLAKAIETQSDVNKAFSALSLAFSSALNNAYSASESDLLLAKSLNSLRFTHSDLAVSGLNFANMDYAELNLGTGKDTFTANAAVSRADAFQTFTVVNTGSGKDVDANGVSLADDTITVGSYKSMTGTQIAEGTLAYSGSITTADFEEQYTYTLSSLAESSETALLNTNLTGWFVEITDASGATERREIVGGTLAVGATMTLARKFTMAITAETSFRIVGQVISSGTVQTPVVTAPTTVSSMTLSSVWSYSGRSLQTGDVLVLREVITATNGSTSYGEASRHVITAVSGNTVTFDGAVDGNGRSYTYRVETKLSDDQLVINAQAGNDTITATGDGITREGLIVFGGNGADTITVDNSAYVFGDRGQVIYTAFPEEGSTSTEGKVVTRLGSTGTDVNVVDNSDYATESERGTGTIQSVPAYLQTDGVRREATYFQTMNNTDNDNQDASQHDSITINGDNNIVFGGKDGDTIQINGSTNVALGDGGRLDFDLVTDANKAAQYGDEVKRYLHYVRTVDDPQGGADTINTGDGDNILFGGAVKDTLTSRSGDDIIVGDGGELELDESRNPVRVSNEGRLVGGADYISAGTGLNTVFGGVDNDTIITGVDMQSTSADLREAFSNDTDVVLGDNGYRTFQGTATDVETTGVISFNFQGNASSGLDAAATTGADGVAVSHWNNVVGSIAGTYGNNPSEIVTLASGERITGVTLSYGGLENNRLTSTDSTIQLQAYTQSLNVTGAGATLMGSGLLTTAPNNQSNNRLGVEVDGLKQHFSTYDVIVYLDAPDNCSDLDGSSVRKVTIYQNGVACDCFYLNDASGSKYSGSYIQATAKSAAAALIPTSEMPAYANYVVFTGLTGDNFRVEITDGVTDEALNGLDLPSIAGIQVKGTYYLQDKVASSGDVVGGNDSISTGGGNDIVIGGAGSDVIATFGDVRYGESDADLVYGDDASITLMDRDGDGVEEVTRAVSTGYNGDLSEAGLSFNDTIVTGNGNDTVVGGDGTDRILTQSQDELAADILADSGDLGVTIAPFALVEEVLTSLRSWDTEDLTVFSINLTSRNADSDSVVHGRAGVVADENWNNICLSNGRFYVYGSDYNSTTAPMNLTYTEDGDESSTTSVGVSILAYDTTNYNTSNYNNSSITEEYHDELDSDSENSKLFNSYLQAQSQQRIQLTLTNLNAVVGNNAYDVYVYLDVENSSTDTYNYIYQIFSASNGSYAGETYYLNDWTGNNFNGEFREVTASSANTDVSNGITPSVEMIGNYVVFHNVTGSTFNVFLQNYHTGSGQWPKNMPAITGVQVVVNNTQNADGTEKALPENGDFDKDVVIGDNGKVNFALDIPYGVNELPADYRNKVITADSMATSFTGSTVVADSNDFITTGRNQDTIIGGNGSDAIDSGAGDDVVIGDNADVEMMDYNPVGVRIPDTEIILDQLTINTSNNEAYIGMGNTTASTFTAKWNAGGVPGVTLTDSDLSGNDIIDAGLDNDFVIGGAGKDVLIANEGQTDVLISESQDKVIDSESYATKDDYLADLTAVLAKLDANDQGILNSFVNNDFDPYLLPTLGSILTETYEEPEGPSGGTVSGTYTLTAYQSQSITLAEGETVELVSSANFGGNEWWTPNVVLQINASSATTLGWSWTDDGETQSATTTASGYYVVNIADAPNEDGLYVIRLTAVTAGTINVAIAQG